MEKVQDHVSDGVALLIDALRKQPLFAALVSTYLKQIQSLEDALWETVARQGLEDVTGDGFAEGTFLDALGVVVGEPRQNRSDADYIPALKAKIKANNSDGQVETLLAILRLILPEAVHGSIFIVNHGQMELTAGVSEPITDTQFEDLARFMILAVDAVAGLHAKLYPVDVSEVFRFSDTYAADEAPAPTNGWGSEYETTGGLFIHEIALEDSFAGPVVFPLGLSGDEIGGILDLSGDELGNFMDLSGDAR